MSDGIVLTAKETPDLAAMAIRELHDAAVDLTFAAAQVTTVRDALKLHQAIEEALQMIEHASFAAITKADEILKEQS